MQFVTHIQAKVSNNSTCSIILYCSISIILFNSPTQGKVQETPMLFGHNSFQYHYKWKLQLEKQMYDSGIGKMTL